MISAAVGFFYSQQLRFPTLIHEKTGTHALCITLQLVRVVAGGEVRPDERLPGKFCRQPGRGIRRRPSQPSVSVLLTRNGYFIITQREQRAELTEKSVPGSTSPHADHGNNPQRQQLTASVFTLNTVRQTIGLIRPVFSKASA